MDMQVRWDRDKNKVVSVMKHETDLKDGDEVIGTSRGTITQEIDPKFVQKDYQKLQADKNYHEKQLRENRIKVDSIVLKYPEEELKQLAGKLEDLNRLKEKDKAQMIVDNCIDALKKLNDHINKLRPVVEKIKK
jgi:hypothetical protein